MTAFDQVAVAYRAILRTEAPSATVSQVGARIAAGTYTIDDYITSQLELVATSTIPAFVFAARFLGAAPSSAYLDALSDFSVRQYDAYVAMGSANAQLGPYEALGRAFADTTAFRDKYGFPVGGLNSPMENADFVRAAYAGIFGRPPSDHQYANLKGQVDYFEAIYRAAGMSAEDAIVRARGATYGQMIGYQQTLPSERAWVVADEQARAFLTTVAKGETAAYGAALETLPVDGRTIHEDDIPRYLTTRISPDSNVAEARTTIYNDTVTVSQLKVRGLGVWFDHVDTGAGDDVLNLGMTGAVTANAGPGNDMIYLSPNSTGGTIDGGDGVDSLSMTGPASILVKNVENVRGSDDAQTLRIALSSNTHPVTIALGGGADRVEMTDVLSNLKLTNGAVSGFATWADFKKGEDKLQMFGSWKSAPAPVDGAATLEAALATISASTAITQSTVFEFGGSTYVFTQNGSVALGDGDGLIKLAGVTGLSVGSNGDIVFV